MSNSVERKSDLGTALGALTDRFQSALTSDGNKPDFKELDLGSPVSTLRAHTRDRSFRGSDSAPLAVSSGSSSSSSGSPSGRIDGNAAPSKRSGAGSGSLFGELPGSSEGSLTTCTSARSDGSARLVHLRSSSGGTPLIHSGGSSVNSPNATLLPSGNICPSGRIGKKAVASGCSSVRSDILRSGTGNYGYGSIMKSDLGGDASSLTANMQFAGDSVMLKQAMANSDPEEVKKAGNEQYRGGKFLEALTIYDRAIAMSPSNAAYRSNRAAALTALCRLDEAIRECNEAVRLDPGYWRAHQRIAALYLRLGQVQNARKHIFMGKQPDACELQKLQMVERHLNRCADARKVGDWKSAIVEADAAIASGADSSPQLFACRAEALLKCHELEEADCALSNVPKFHLSSTLTQTKFFGMQPDSYLFFVRAQIEMALGRFENAVAAAEKAGQMDTLNKEVNVMVNSVRSVAASRAHGNDLFNSSKFAEASRAYGEGLNLDPSNPVLYCNRAACWFKLKQWEKCIDDCNEALKIHPNYTKAILRRAACNDMLERWAESVHDYEVLMRVLPDDKEIAESLFHAQAALKKPRRYGGKVKEITGYEQYRSAVSSPGISVILFTAASNRQSLQMAPCFDALCVKYPLNFRKVDIDQTPAVAKAESVRIVPTIKIFKNGNLVKEMICPSEQVLEHSVKHYSI